MDKSKRKKLRGKSIKLIIEHHYPRQPQPYTHTSQDFNSFYIEECDQHPDENITRAAMARAFEAGRRSKE